MMGSIVKRGMTTLLTVLILTTFGFFSFIVIDNFTDNNTATAATVHYVGGTGPGNYSTIQAAINNASDGDTIYVWEGIYHENIVVNRMVSLIGNGTENTTINSTSFAYNVYVSSNWVNISGFKITSGSNNSNGIYLFGVSNCNISNNNCSSNRYGIYLMYSDKNTIKNNTCNSNSYFGISLYLSYKNKFVNNTCDNNTYNGFFISTSENNQLINNTCRSSSEYGIFILDSINITLINNTLVYDGIYLEGSILKHYNSHNIDITNTVNDKPVHYLKNQVNKTVQSGAGQVILANCTNITVETQNLSSGDVGVILGYSNNNVILNNNCSNNYHGISLFVGENNQFINNNCSGILLGKGINFLAANNNIVINNSFVNNFEGIRIDYSNNNCIMNNTCDSNVQDGISIYESNSNTFSNNSCSLNNYGIRLSHSEENKLVNNTCDINFNLGMTLFQSYRNSLSNNSGNQNDFYGLHLSGANSNTIINNEFSFNSNNGIYSYDSINNTISDNFCTNNFYCIELRNSDDNKLINNTCLDSTEGIYLSSSFSNTVIDNKCNQNNENGIYAGYSNYNFLENNSCNENNFCGINIDISHNNILINNNCTSNDNGIFTRYSNNGQINNNNCSINYHSGIYIYESDSTKLANNTCNSNDESGIELYNSNYNRIEYSVCNYNFDNGIYIIASDSNIINRNICHYNGDHGIEIAYSENNDVINNTCNSNQWSGLYLTNAQSNTIANNNYKSNYIDGIYLTESSYNTISNSISYNNVQHGINLENSLDNTIANNKCELNGDSGINFAFSESNDVGGNNCSDNNRIGINLYSADYNKISNNIFSNNDYAIYINSDCDNNMIYHNNIIDNVIQAIDEGYKNQWDNDYWEGNYWSDYQGIDNGLNGRMAGDGIGDTEIPHLGLDNYPFINPYGWFAPDTPVLVDPGGIDYDGNYTLSWVSYDDVDKFVLQEDTTIEFNSPNLINYDIGGSMFQHQITYRIEGTYYYRLRAYKGPYYGCWSNMVNMTVEFGPDVPKDLRVEVNPEGNELEIYWDTNNDDTTYYLLYVKTIGAWPADNEPFANITHPNNNFNHKELVDGIEYFYRIRAGNFRGQISDYCTPVSGIPVDSVAPSVPTGLFISNKTYDSIKLEWHENIDEDVMGYNVYRSKMFNPSTWGDPVNGDTLINATKFEDTGLEEGTAYYYVITAVDEVPNESSYSLEVTTKTYLFSKYPQSPVINKPPPNIFIPEDSTDDISINLNDWFKDANGDTLEFRCYGDKHINVTIDQLTGKVVLKPEENWCGKEVLTFFADDGVFDEIFDIITITVQPVNDSPGPAVILLPTDGMKVNYGVGLDFEAACADPDLPFGDQLTFTWHLSNNDSILGEGQILSDIKLPIGNHLIRLSVSDLAGLTANATVNVEVIEKDDAEAVEVIGANLGLLIISCLIILIIILVILYLFLRRKKKQKQEQPTEPQPEKKKKIGVSGKKKTSYEEDYLSAGYMEKLGYGKSEGQEKYGYEPEEEMIEE